MPADRCLCASCYAGEPHAFTNADEARIERALTRSGHARETVSLRVLTGGQPRVLCDGSMLCGCSLCTEQRAVLAAAGPKVQPKQPWELRRAA